MKKIRTITFPRSGIHLVSGFLLKYFSRDIKFPLILTFNPKTTPIKAGEFVLCSKDHHRCGIPCTDPSVTFQMMHEGKAHGLLKWEVGDGINYLFLYRNPVISAISMFRNGFDKTLQETVILLDCQMKWWKEWIYYWVIGHNGDNILKVVYENIIENPEKEFERIIKYIEPNENANKELILSIVKNGFPDINGKPGINIKFELSEFKYYKELKNYLQEKEQELIKEIKLLNIPRIKWE